MIYPYNFPKLGISHEQYLTNNKNLIKENREKWINNVLEQIKKEGIKLDEKFLFYASNMFYKALSPILMNSFKKINCRTGELCR
jgi:hypothetical protein